MKFLPPRDAHFLLISDFFCKIKTHFSFSTEVADLMIFMHEDLVDSNFIIFFVFTEQEGVILHQETLNHF